MRPSDLYKPTVAMSYVAAVLDLAAERSIAREVLLRDLGIATASADARVSALQYARLSARLLRCSGDPALGLELGLRSRLCQHGPFGYGVISQPCVRKALEFCIRHARLRMPAIHLRLVEDRDAVAIELHETLELGPLRPYTIEAVQGALVALLRLFLADTDLELWFQGPEPGYFAPYRSRLPPTRFAMGANQLRIARAALDRPLPTADAETAQLLRHHCERESALINLDADFMSRVRALLTPGDKGYPPLRIVAERLCMSPRTLKRRLQEHGSGFHRLLDEARQRDAVRLLRHSGLAVDEIAMHLGYAERASFTRAFRRFTGTTPSQLRLGSDAGGGAPAPGRRNWSDYSSSVA